MSSPSEEMVVRAAIRDELSGPLERIREEIRATGDQAEKTGRKANLGARGFDVMAGGAARLAKKAGSLVTTLGKAGLAGAIGLVSTALYKGFGRLKGLEDATAKLDGLGHSAKTIERIMGNALAAVKGTAFGMDEAATTAAGAVAAGIKPGKQLERILTLVGDSATIAGTSMGEMGAIWNKVAASNKLQGEVIAQLSERGIPILQLLSKHLGENVETVLKLSQQGKISFADFAAAMEKGMGGAAQKSGETLTGAYKNTMAALGRIGANILGGIYPQIRGGLTGAITLLGGLEDKAAGLGEKIGAKVKILGDHLALATLYVKSFAASYERGGLDMMAANIGETFGVDAPGALETFRGMLADVGTILREVLVPALTDAADLLPTILSPLTLIDDVLGFLADHTTATKVAIEGLVIALTAIKAITILWGAYSAVVGAVTAVTAGYTAATYGAAGATYVSGGALKVYTVLTKAHAAATKVVTAAQWLWNAALSANPIGLVVVGLSLLIGGLILAYKKSENFRKIVDKTWSFLKKLWGTLMDNKQAFLALLGPVGLFAAALITAWKKSETFRRVVTGALAAVLEALGMILDRIASLLDALSHVPGFGWAKTAANQLRDAADQARGFADAVRGIPDKKAVDIPVTIRAVGGDQLGNVGRNRAIVEALTPTGDTPSSRARGGGLGLGNTYAAHAEAMAATGARPTITNVLVGGGGRGRGSGDHQAGRALDLVGPGVGRYGAYMRSIGGFAEFHGSGAGRHLHAVPPPMGDTRSSVAARVKAPARNGGGTITIERGAIAVTVHQPTDNVDVEVAVADAIEAWLRDREERS